MSNILYKNRFLIARRVTQISIMLLYIIANIFGIKILIGNLSSSLLFGLIPLSDPFAVLQMLFAGAVLSIDIIVGALIITTFYFIVGGRVFCSWVCPVNMITDLSNYTRRKLGFDKIQKKQPASRNIRYWAIALTMIISYLLGVGAFEFISPIGMVQRGIIFGLGFGLATIVVIFLFDLFVLKNGWCGHICPLGGFYSIVGKFGLVRVEHNADKCTLCMKCKTICPENQVLFMVGKESKQVLSGECTNCARCIEVCDDDALNFSIKKFYEENMK